MKPIVLIGERRSREIERVGLGFRAGFFIGCAKANLAVGRGTDRIQTNYHVDGLRGLRATLRIHDGSGGCSFGCGARFDAVTKNFAGDKFRSEAHSHAGRGRERQCKQSQTQRESEANQVFTPRLHRTNASTRCRAREEGLGVKSEQEAGLAQTAGRRLGQCDFWCNERAA